MQHLDCLQPVTVAQESQLMPKVAMLLSCDTFEDFFGKTFGLDRDSYLANYRNDFAWDYAAGLREQNIDAIIYVLSLNYSGFYETPDHFKVRFIPLAPWYRVARKFVSRFKRFLAMTYLSEWVNMQAFIHALPSCLTEDKFSLLYIQEYWTNRFDFLVNRLNLPMIGAGHGAPDRFAIAAEKHKSLPKAVKLICQSQEDLLKVKNYGGNAVLISNSADTDFYCPDSSIARKDKVILTVARLEDRQKRTSDLIRALAHLEPSWTLEIVGSGPNLKSLQNLAKQLKVSDRVRFLGFIRDKHQLREKYRQCSVFALPSAWEAVSLVVLEAMSCGAAVVTSDIETFRELVINQVSGTRVPVGDPLALAQGIAEADKDRDRLGQAGREIVVNSYSKRRMFQQLAQVIQDGNPAVLPADRSVSGSLVKGES